MFSDAHDTPSIVVHAISIQSARSKTTSSLENMMCSWARVIARNCQEEWNMRKKNCPMVLCTSSVLAIAAWNVRTLIDIVSQAITAHILSKYRLLVGNFPHFWSRIIIKSGSQVEVLCHCDVSDKLEWNGIAIVWKKSDWEASKRPYNLSSLQRKVLKYSVINTYAPDAQMTTQGQVLCGISTINNNSARRLHGHNRGRMECTSHNATTMNSITGK